MKFTCFSNTFIVALSICIMKCTCFSNTSIVALGIWRGIGGIKKGTAGHPTLAKDGAIIHRIITLQSTKLEISYNQVDKNDQKKNIYI